MVAFQLSPASVEVAEFTDYWDSSCSSSHHDGFRGTAALS
jgi:hypothetical protein